MPAEAGFRIAIKDSAREVIDPETLAASEASGQLECSSRAAAEASIEDLPLSEAGTLHLQRPAPNDPADVDAYLVFYPETRKRNPDGSLDDGWTFDTTANQYGDLGEAIITAPGTPALDHFVRQDLAESLSEDLGGQLYLEVRTQPKEFDWETLRSVSEGDWLSWTPDCEVRVYLPGHEGLVHRYFCEIKTGDASFERNQSRDMNAVSDVADVLKIRITIDGLPDEYSVKFRRAGDSRPDIAQASIATDVPTGDQVGLSDFLD